MLGFLFTYAKKLKLGLWSTIIGFCSAPRQLPPLQGVGPMIGNMLMGIVFGWVYQKYGRVMPLSCATSCSMLSASSATR
ncbi:hypothetical protein GCM10017709_34440 [Glutamicibacter nicotianae]